MRLYELLTEYTISEFAPGPGGDDGSGDDPYKYPKPEHFSRSVDFFGQFESGHFDREDIDDATGVFKGYWGKDQIAYFKFDNPRRTGSDDPGMGWYYEPSANSNDSNDMVGHAADDSAQRKQQELSMIRAFLKSGQTAKPGSQIYSLMKRHGVAEGKLGNVISWPEVVNKITSAMKATGWKGQRQSDDAFMFSTKGQLDDEWYIAIIDNVGDGFFTYALGTVEEGDPYIDDAFKGKLPNTEASVSELLNIIRDGYGLNEATYKGREVNLGVPVKHGEHFFVYQKDPITLRVKKIILKDPTKKIKQIKHRRRRH